MNSADIRRTFLDYFKKNQHTEVPSSLLVPFDDPTLLFANAGMNQFKRIFMGDETLPYKRATSSQKCIRAGGKHNDLENVGETARHHTFFEMLGNFSFGDYFKEEAIYFCWELMTKVYGFDPKRLWATVYLDDDEAFNLWKKIAPELGDRVLRFDEKENYWSMGDTGPCGPCAEIHIDRGEKFDYGGPSSSVNGHGDRFVELWNLVFMQFNRDENGKLSPLPKPSVDTGAGLERFACVLQNAETNFESDLFMPIIRHIEEITGKKYTIGPQGLSHRVIADHIRALTFAFTDGAVPSNEKRGYVLRRILRRAARHGRLLDMKEPFIYKLAGTVSELMGTAYPDLKAKLEHTTSIIKAEEERFGETLDMGLELFDKVVEKVTRAKGQVIPGEEAFKLYDTFGFPLDLTELMARERGLTVDVAGFEEELSKQQEKSKEDYRSKGITFGEKLVDIDIKTAFCGYNDNFVRETTLLKVIPTDEAGQYIAILKDTPFYAESGGQIGDKGIIHNGGFKFEVQDTRKQGETILHIGRNIKGEIASFEGKTITAEVDSSLQKPTQRNHTATHILHKALQEVLGEHVRQAGSWVAPDRFRFDFTHFKAVEPSELQLIEEKVNRVILENRPVKWIITDFDTAKSKGAMALFGEKYGEEVRMVEVEGYSRELCGGTHVKSSGEIGPFVIISESAIAAGMRRIEALTGENALHYLKRKKEEAEAASQVLKVPTEKLVERVISLTESEKQLARELNDIKQKQKKKIIEDNLKQPEKINSISVTWDLSIEGKESALTYYDLQKQIPGATVGAFLDKNGHNFYITSSAEAINKYGIKAQEVSGSIGKILETRGGGNNHFAQGGSKSVINQDHFMKELRKIIEEKTKDED